VITQRSREIVYEIFDKPRYVGLDDERYGQLCDELSKELTAAQVESLGQLVKNGPVWDGDVISKQTRGELLDLRLASRAVIKGEEGYTVANYVGAKVYRHRFGEGKQ
jgi:hypothetical protein